MHYRLDALQERAGDLYLLGEPFTGVAYEVRGDRVVGCHQVSGGQRGGPPRGWDSARSRALLSALTFVQPEETDPQFPREGVYLGGTFFEGVGYAFDKGTGLLLKEQDFRTEPPAPCREWYPSGVLQADLDRWRPDGAWESETYYEGGQTRTVESDKIGWGLSPEGDLRTLRLAPGYPKADLQRVPLVVDSRLYLASAGVTDEILSRLDGLSRVGYLHLDGIGASPTGLEVFIACVDLKELVTRNSAGCRDTDVRKLLAGLPSCQWTPR